MRILFVSHSLPPKGRPLANLGGMQRVAAKLLDALHARDDVVVEEAVLRAPWKWIHYKVGPYLLRTGWTLRQRAKRGDIDLVLFSSMVTAALAVPLRGVLRAQGVRTAAIVHGLDVTTPFPPYQWFVPKVFDALDAVLPVSRATGAACTERGLAPEKMHVVPNGIDLDRFDAPGDKTAMRAELVDALDAPESPLPSDALLLCSVGRQVKRKGFDWFAAHVMPRLPSDVHYWIAGDGPEAETIQAAIDANRLNDRVRRLGRISEANLARLYRGADLYIMPNVPVPGDMEGFGVVMLEAGQCGCPVVAARLEGIRDVITEGVNGHLVEPQAPDAFVNAIVPYYRNPETLAEAGQEAAEHIKARFSWTAVADRYVDVLHSVWTEGVPAEDTTPSPVADA